MLLWKLCCRWLTWQDLLSWQQLISRKSPFRDVCPVSHGLHSYIFDRNRNLLKMVRELLQKDFCRRAKPGKQRASCASWRHVACKMNNRKRPSTAWQKKYSNRKFSVDKRAHEMRVLLELLLELLIPFELNFLSANCNRALDGSRPTCFWRNPSHTKAVQQHTPNPLIITSERSKRFEALLRNAKGRNDLRPKRGFRGGVIIINAGPSTTRFLSVSTTPTCIEGRRNRVQQHIERCGTLYTPKLFSFWQPDVGYEPRFNYCFGGSYDNRTTRLLWFALHERVTFAESQARKHCWNCPNTWERPGEAGDGDGDGGRPVYSRSRCQQCIS